MRKATGILLAALGLSTAVLAYDNNPPIPGRHVGWTYGNGSATGVEIELVYDLACSDCAYYAPLFEQFLDMPFYNSSVRESVKLTYVFMPLPYHHEAWIMTKLAPYFIDKCLESSDSCLYYQYADFCFKNQDFILSATSTPQDALIPQWVDRVAQTFCLNRTELLSVYDEEQDTHNSEMRTRYMWKYATSRQVSGTPTAFVNGIQIQNWPDAPTDWMTLLTDVISSQSPTSSKQTKKSLSIVQ